MKTRSATVELSTALFWIITQRVEFITDVSGPAIGLQGLRITQALELFVTRADGRTDMKKIIGAILKLIVTNALKNSLYETDLLDKLRVA